MERIARVARRVVPITAFALAVAMAGAGSTATAASDERGRSADNRARGMVHAGLVWADKGPCVGGWRVDVPGLDNICTHGPDPAPEGVDVTSIAYEFATGPTTTMDAAPAPCIGDGVSGKRVQAVYAVAADRTDKYDYYLPTIVSIAGQMDATVNASAAATGGERHVRFVTNPDCTLNVAKVILSPTGDDTFSNTINELRALGFTSPDRKYLIWADALVYCGIGQIFGDDSPGITNMSNTYSGFARVDKSCWGRSDHLSELHELMHTLGSVQLTAPHGTQAFHCTDESDAMCYSDAAGVTMSQVCPVGEEWLLDCGHDDYFNTSPPAGSYLDTHWNTADSVFLSASLTEDPTPPTDPVVEVVTETFTGSVSAKRPTKSFNVATGSGSATSELTFSSTVKTKTTPQMTLKVVAPDGSVAASGTGPSVLKSVATLPAATYRVDVTAAASLSFTLSVTHVKA